MPFVSHPRRLSTRRFVILEQSIFFISFSIFHPVYKNLFILLPRLYPRARPSPPFAPGVFPRARFREMFEGSPGTSSNDFNRKESRGHQSSLNSNARSVDGINNSSVYLRERYYHGFLCFRRKLGSNCVESADIRNVRLFIVLKSCFPNRIRRWLNISVNILSSRCV